MNAGLIKSSAAVLVAGLLLTGCENMSPEANGAVFGAGAGILAGGLAAAVGASPAQAVAIGLAAGTVAGVTAYVVAKRKATERQRQYAEERARLAYERASAERRAQYKKSRYIAVDTVREKDSVGAKSVMIYDTQTQQVVGNNVYDVKQAPKQGTVSKFDTYSAEYVGTGA
jgi:membrane protein implicated in regulation of membrane protease activity